METIYKRIDCDNKEQPKKEGWYYTDKGKRWWRGDKWEGEAPTWWLQEFQPVPST